MSPMIWKRTDQNDTNISVNVYESRVKTVYFSSQQTVIKNSKLGVFIGAMETHMENTQKVILHNMFFKMYLRLNLHFWSGFNYSMYTYYNLFKL